MRDDFPLTITLDQIRAALEALGIPIAVRDLQALHIEVEGITVEHARTDDQGRFYLGLGDATATTTTTIGIDKQP
jgi:hypothetical protein